MLIARQPYTSLSFYLPPSHGAKNGDDQISKTKWRHQHITRFRFPPIQRRSAPAVMTKAHFQRNKTNPPATRPISPSAAKKSSTRRKADTTDAEATSGSRRRKAYEKDAENPNSRPAQQQKTTEKSTTATNSEAHDPQSASQNSSTPLVATYPPPSTFTDGLPLPKFIFLTSTTPSGPSSLTIPQRSLTSPRQEDKKS